MLYETTSAHMHCQTDKPNTQGASGGFTLVELLVVIAVIILLAIIAVPSIGLVGSQTLSSSGNQMVDVFNMARQNSISNNVYTAIIVKTQGSGAYTAYCTLYLPMNDDGSYGSWQTLASWRYLPQGIVFSPPSRTAGASPFNVAGASFSSSPPSSFPSYPFQGGQINLYSPTDPNPVTASEIYQPDGTLSAGQTLTLTLAQGTVGSNGAPVYTHPNSAGSPANYYNIVIVRDTGQTTIERL